MNDMRLPEHRLLSPQPAAIYLGLPSRVAVDRLVASGRRREDEWPEADRHPYEAGARA